MMSGRPTSCKKILNPEQISQNDKMKHRTETNHFVSRLVLSRFFVGVFHFQLMISLLQNGHNFSPFEEAWEEGCVELGPKTKTLCRNAELEVWK